MADLEILLRCTGCEAYRPFERRKRGSGAVACAECGKRHSTDSLYPIDPANPPAYGDPP